MRRVRVPLLHVGHAEDEGEEHAQRAHGDVAHGQEVVLPAQRVGGGDDEGLGALEGRDVVVVLDLEPVVAGREGDVDAAPELAEVGEASCAHPHDEVLCKELGRGFITYGWSCRTTARLASLVHDLLAH